MRQPRPATPARNPAQRRRFSLAALLGAAALGFPGAVQAFTVHEWGTFTSVYSSAGVALPGLYTDASRLPAFVHGLPYFNWSLEHGWPAPDRLRNVTVKMETPVLYFYSTPEVDVSVKVGFKGGTISQWYPQRSGGEANPVTPFVDFAQEPYQGHISWKAKVLQAGTDLPYTAPEAGMTEEWRAPRATAANLLRGQNGEIEKFLFYRGLGGFSSAVHLEFEGPEKLIVTNRSGEDIPYLQIYDQGGQMYMNPIIWWQGPVAAHARLVFTKPAAPNGSNAGQAMRRLEEEMVKAGLHKDEALALLHTWYNGYFLETGFKAFWIVPRRQVDALLPLEISPAPEAVARVIVGRTEILTPDFESKLRSAGMEAAPYKDHKYRMAFQALLADWDAYHPQASSVSERLPAARPAARAPWVSPLFPRGGARDARGRKVINEIR